MSYIIPENALPSKVLYVDSRDAQKYLATNSAGDNIHSYFSYILKEPIEVPPNQRALISLHSATIPFSFYNIRVGVNDTIPIKVENLTQGTEYNHTLTITPSNYTVYTLGSFLRDNIPPLFEGEVDFSITPDFDLDSMKYTYTLVGLEGDINDELRMTWDFTGDNTEAIANIETGFSLKEVVFNYVNGENNTTISNNVVDINGSIHGVYIRTNLVSNSTLDSQNGTFSNILSRIPINVQSGGLIFQVASNSTHKALVDMNYLNNITIRLTDERNRILDLNGLHFQIAVSVDFTYAKKPNMIQTGALGSYNHGDSFLRDTTGGEESRRRIIQAQIQNKIEEEENKNRRRVGRPRKVGRPKGS